MEKVILIAVAMKNELNTFLEKVENFEKREIDGIDFYEGQLLDKKIVCMLTGIGTINTSYAFGIAISNFNIDFVINYGIAGGIGENVHKNTIVAVEDCFNVSSYRTSELNHGTDNFKWEYLTFVDDGADNLTIYNSDENLLNKLKECDPIMPIVRCGSGDIWNREKDVILNLKNNYSVDVADMECVSLYRLCNKLNIPVISFKAISDNVILSEDYDRNILDNTNSRIIEFIYALIK